MNISLSISYLSTIFNQVLLSKGGGVTFFSYSIQIEENLFINWFCLKYFLFTLIIILLNNYHSPILLHFCFFVDQSFSTYMFLNFKTIFLNNSNQYIISLQLRTKKIVIKVNNLFLEMMFHGCKARNKLFWHTQTTQFKVLF